MVGTRFLPDLKPLDAIHPSMVVCDIHSNDLYAMNLFSADRSKQEVENLCTDVLAIQKFVRFTFLAGTNRGNQREKREMEIAQMKLSR